MEFNADELVAPTWMDKQFFEKVLRSSEKDEKIVVMDFAVKPGTKPGDHFASVMFRISINYKSANGEEKNQKVVLKTTPFIEGFKKDLLKDTPLFDIEIRMYTKTLQDLDRLLKSIGETFTLAPRHMYSAFEPQPVLVLEDISPMGYVMLEKPMDLDQGLLVMSRLAKFHAASVFLNENGGNTESYNKSFLAEDNDFMDKLFRDNINLFTKEMKAWGPEYEIYYEKFDKIKDEIVNLSNHLFVKNKPGQGYNVLNHGDFHAKNLLVKWDEETKIENDLVLLDFQLCFWASPALDIIYGLYNMVPSEVRQNHRGELVHHYHNEFSDVLKKLNYTGKIPSLQDLNMEILKKGELEVVLATCFLHYNFVDLTSVDFEMEDFFKDDDKGLKATSMKNPEFLDIIRRELPIYLHKGFLK